MEFAEKIRILRKEMKLSQTALGEKVGLSMRGYQDLELGAKPKYDTLLRIAEFYDVSVDWLMSRTEKREVNRQIMEFAERLRRLRRASHLTQAELAAQIGMAARGYQDIELGHLPRYENLLRIAEFYDVSVDWLMGRTDKREVNRQVMEFAERIRMLRKERNMTQAEAGAQIGLTMRGYQNMELGSEPRYRNILRIAEFYGVSVDWLMGRTDKREVNR